MFGRKKHVDNTVSQSEIMEKERTNKLEEKKREIVHKNMLAYENENRKKEKIAPSDSMISLQHINKIYPNHVQAVYDFNLEIKEKEFIVLVGPSGCGKSTTLRMIAGLEDITAGDLYINKKYANDLLPIDRSIAMVFQSYALYPHMTVFENMSFGLEMQHFKTEYILENTRDLAQLNGALTTKNSAILDLNNRIDEKKSINEAIDLFAKTLDVSTNVATILLASRNNEANLEKAKAKLEKESMIELAKVEKNGQTFDPVTFIVSKDGVVEYHKVKLSQEEISRKVYWAAKILNLEDYLDRKPSKLSGGQRQRVALGRAIVKNSKVFLMDEPLSNLDAKLRVQMRSQIVRIHRNLGATTVYVTHDQTEAMTMGNRIVVMKLGRVQQIGTPNEIYNNPSNVFVATFIGSPGMNIFNAKYHDGNVKLDDDFSLKLSPLQTKQVKEYYENKVQFYKDEIIRLKEEIEQNVSNEDYLSIKEINEAEIEKDNALLEHYNQVSLLNNVDVKFGIRPEDIAQVGYDQLVSNKSSKKKIDVIISESLGNEFHLHAEINNTEFVAKINANHEVNSDDTIEVIFNMDKVHVFDSKSEEAIF